MSTANPYGYPSWMLTPRHQASVRACTRVLKSWEARNAERHAWAFVYDGVGAGQLLRTRRKYGPGSPKSSTIGPIVYGTRRRTRRWNSIRRDVGGGSPHDMYTGASYHSALTAARAEAKKCRTPWYIKQHGAAWYMTDSHPTVPYVKVHVDERAIKHLAGDPSRRRNRKRPWRRR